MLTIDQELEQYIKNNSTPEDEVLFELNRKTHLEVLQPRMLSGHLQGKLLEMISYMINPESILEIGTYTGYSAICLSKGLKQGGKLITIEKNDELEEFILTYFEKAGVKEKIKLYIGNALEIIHSQKSYFDLIFIDADKQEYIDYYEAVLPKLKKGGFILADNVLWDGKVIDKNEKDDPDTKAIVSFNKHVVNDPRVENIVLPIRDGISLIRKT